MKKNALRYSFDGIAAVCGAIASKALELPHGLASGSFVYIVAPVFSLVGHELGHYVGRSKQKRARWSFIVFGTLVGLVWYHWLLHRATPGVATVVLLYLSFSLMFFCLFFVLGLHSVAMFDSKSERVRTERNAHKGGS